MMFNADKIASMVQTIGTEHFGAAVIGMLDPRLGIAHCTAFEQAGEAAPRCIMAAGSGESADHCARTLAADYVASGYARDPVLALLRRRASPNPKVDYIEAAELIANDHERAEFIDHFYRHAGVAQEATYSLQADERLLWVTLYRRAGGAGFDQRERLALHDLSRLLLSSARRQGQLLPSAVPAGIADADTQPGRNTGGEDWGHSRVERLARIRSALLLTPCGLTPREADICAHIVVGYPVLAISLNLGISINTVATHRKRAYAKLGMSSQTELFSACLRYGASH